MNFYLLEEADTLLAQYDQSLRVCTWDGKEVGYYDNIKKTIGEYRAELKTRPEKIWREKLEGRVCMVQDIVPPGCDYGPAYSDEILTLTLNSTPQEYK